VVKESGRGAVFYFTLAGQGSAHERARHPSVEDNANDEELTLRALNKSNIANKVVIAPRRAERLDYLFGRVLTLAANAKELAGRAARSELPKNRRSRCLLGRCRITTGSKLQAVIAQIAEDIETGRSWANSDRAARLRKFFWRCGQRKHPFRNRLVERLRPSRAITTLFGDVALVEGT